jgi:single-strand DNA-binding protein
MGKDLNSVSISGRLTRDPELRATPTSSVCDLRVAVNGSRKDATGAWVDDANFFNVSVWGAQGESCANHLEKGSRIAIHGRLNWHEWETPDGGKRQAVDVIADSVVFLSFKSEDGAPPRQAQLAQQQPAGVSAADFGGDDDIPF